MAREEAKSAVEDNLLTTILLRDSALEVVEAWRRSFEVRRVPQWPARVTC